MVLRGEGKGQLRWVLVDPVARGAGLGRRLVEGALDYCRDNDCQSVYLETTDGLAESQALYESLGFNTVVDRPEELWDGVRPLIQMELSLA
jgi:GNAT superfamily N-acetyltransferase